jgi:hypothetical protein
MAMLNNQRVYIILLFLRAETYKGNEELGTRPIESFVMLGYLVVGSSSGLGDKIQNACSKKIKCVYWKNTSILLKQYDKYHNIFQLITNRNTWFYTKSHAHLVYPVLAFNLTSAANRIKQHNPNIYTPKTLQHWRKTIGKIEQRRKNKKIKHKFQTNEKNKTSRDWSLRILRPWSL